jgi:hypothetical protein
MTWKKRVCLVVKVYRQGSGKCATYIQAACPPRLGGASAELHAFDFYVPFADREMADTNAAFQMESKAPLINSLAIIFVVLSTISVILRLYTRKRLLDVLGADDITISIAQILAIAVSTLTILRKWLPKATKTVR